MTKKIILLSLCSLLLAPCSAVEAQQQVKIRRIGFLGDTPPSRLDAFRNRLRDFGWIEGRNLAIEYRPHDGKREMLLGIATELVNLKADLIVAPATGSALAAKQATATIPIVMFSSDPRGSGLVDSLARPGGNITGFSNIQIELGGKRLEILKEAFPKITRVAVLLRHGGPGMEQQLKEIEIAARPLHVQVLPIGVEGPDDFGSGFSTIKKERASALIVLSAPFFNVYRTRIVKLAAESRIPAIYPQEFAEAGGLISYGPSYPDMFRRAATYADKILKGASPGDLPVEQATKFELVINLKTANEIGVTIPPNVLARADKVIR